MLSKPQFVGEWVKLGAIVRASSERNKGGHCRSVYSVTNSQGFIPSEEYFSKEVFSKDLNTYRVVKRDMIAYNPSRINVGSVALQNKSDEVVVSPLYVVFSVDESKVMPGYIVRFLKSKPGLDQIAFQSIGTVRNNLKYKALCKMELTLPPLSVQRDRLANLVSIESQISQSRKVIEELDLLVKSRFVEMFGDICEGTSHYDMVPINDLCTCIVGGGTPSMKHPEYYENGTIPWLKSGDVKTHIVESGVLNITEVGLANSSARMVPEGSIIVVTRSGILKHSLPIAKTARSIAINQDLKALIPGDHILPDYLQWSLIVASPLLLSKVRATTADNIETSFLKSFSIPFPPMFLQRKFVKFVDQVDKSRFISMSRYRDILIKNGYRYPHLQGFNR